MNEVGIVVLNYNRYEETIACVDSILNQENVIKKVVIVENGSGNDSLKILTEKYAKIEDVTIISSSENLGYARGNNLGIDYLRSLGMGYILVLNSDTRVSNTRTIYELIKNDENDVGILIPVIKNLDGSIEQRVVYMKKFCRLRILKSLLRILLYRNKKHSINSTNYNEDNKGRVGKQLDRYVVAGSGFMLTPAFFKVYARLFPETFLYCEEIATIIYLYKANLFSKIVNVAEVIHKGAASTPENAKDGSSIKNKYRKNSAKKVFKLIFLTKQSIIKKYNM